MVKINVDKTRRIDFSFMPSLQCDLTCDHCMYDSSPWNKAELDFERTAHFVETMDWSIINACGFYGGEPGIKLEMYSRFIELVPDSIPKFTITDGTWSRTKGRTAKFVEFANRHKLQTFVSSTPFHTPHQDREVLERVCNENELFILKGDDKDIIPMGRMATKIWQCSFRCRTDSRPLRFALKPGGNIIFQTCDGVYPVVGSYNRPFRELMAGFHNSVERCQKQRGGFGSNAG